MTLARKVLFWLVLAVVAVAGVVQWRAHSQETQAENSFPPVGEIIMVDGVPVHAKVMGTGPDLVLIHGASGNLRDFTFDLTAQLVDRYRVILFDRPGLGWTGRLPGYEGAWNSMGEPPQAQAALLQKAADRIGVTNPIVLGHSYGGAVALAWGLARPDATAALVLVSAVSEQWQGGLGWTYDLTGSAAGGALAIPLITAFLPQRAVNASIDAIFAPQKAPAGYGTHIGTGLTLRRTSMRANAQQVNTLLPHITEMAQHYDTLSMPVEILHGTADTIVPAQVHADVLIKDVPNGNLVHLPGMGHMPHHIQPASTLEAIDRAARRAGLL